MRLVSLLLCALVATPALADKPLTRHFGADNSCYERIYSDSHLSKHPHQRVTRIRIDHFPMFSGPFGTDNKPLIYPDASEIVVNLTVNLRGLDQTQSATGFCWPEGNKMGCGLECDGGQFSLTDRGNGKILLRIKNEIYFHDCDEGDVTLSKYPDDRSFLLYRTADSACRPPE